MRLDNVASDVVNKLHQADSGRQRAASIVACQLAIKATQIDNPIVLNALSLLQKDGKLSSEMRSCLNDLAAELDEEYFVLQDKVENSVETSADYLRVFAQARAIAATAFAGGDDPCVAAMESIYEASVCFEDGDTIFNAVKIELSH